MKVYILPNLPVRDLKDYHYKILMLLNLLTLCVILVFSLYISFTIRQSLSYESKHINIFLLYHDGKQSLIDGNLYPICQRNLRGIWQRSILNTSSRLKMTQRYRSMSIE